MKNLYLVQVDVSASTGCTNAYLPYTAGVLAAAAWENSTVAGNYRFGGFVFLREDIKKTAASLVSPDVVGFSNYCWNTEYNKLLSQEIKRRYPDCVIIFGGHNVPVNTSFLEKYPYIDFLCFGEGELTFTKLLAGIASGCVENVKGIAYRGRNGSAVMTASPDIPGELDFPSPYTGGWFDEIVEKHPEITFNAILETSRGCPNKCAYCDWGLLRSRTRLIPMERVLGEIEWMSSHKIAFVWGADANFGMFERDLDIADALIKAKETTGFPERMRMNYAKNNFERVFELIEKFKECEFDRIGATLSFQSLSPAVLEAIGRTNMSLGFFKELLTKYNKKGLKAYSELILGLPCETYESFIDGIGKLFEIGQHYVFEVYGCILLPNSHLGQPDIIKKYGIKTVRSEILRPHFDATAFDVPEYNEIIVETGSMSRENWVKATVFYYLAKAFHGNGLLRAFAIYQHCEKNVPYSAFYDGLLTYFEENPELFTSSLYFDIKSHADGVSRGTDNKKLIFPPAGDVVWDDHEYAVLNILSRFEEFYADVLPYLKKYDYGEGVFEDLLKYQKAVMRRPDDEHTEISLGYDVHSYLSRVYVNEYEPLKKKNVRYSMTDTDVCHDWKSFGKFVIWYGRMGWKSYKDSVKITAE